MYRVRKVLAFLLLGAAAACGQVEPVILAVSMPECTYGGPVAMSEGEASLSLTLNGLGHSRVVVAELTDGHSYDELESHFDTLGDWSVRPEWLRTTMVVELSDAQGLAGAESSARLHEGEYAVVCIDLTTDMVRAASPLQVRS